MKVAISILSAAVALLITIAFSLTLLQAVAVGAASGIVGGLLIVAFD